MLSLALVAFVLSVMLTLWVRRLVRRRPGHYPLDAPQRFHLGAQTFRHHVRSH